MDLCQKVEQDYPYAHAIGNIRAIIGADWIEPTVKVKRVQAVLDELSQRVLERCAGGKDTDTPSKLTLQEERSAKTTWDEDREVLESLEEKIRKAREINA